jgi:uncharacterized membrane protein
VISSGPWFLSIVCLSFLGILSPLVFQEKADSVLMWDIFGSTIVYIFAFSLITTGLITMIITRFIADKIYLNESKAIPATFVSIISIIILVQGLTGIVFFLMNIQSLFYAIFGTMLYIIVSCIWIALLFLSASENYSMIIALFFIGSLVSLGAALLGGKYFALDGFLAGYTLGQAIIFFGFTFVIFDEFGPPRNFTFEFFKYCKQYYELVFIGALYYIAIWADKFIFWFSEHGRQISGLFYNYTAYDSPLFIAYITIVPALAIFLLNIETGFYEEYKAFYEFVMAKQPLRKIVEKKQNMVKIIKSSFLELLKVQGTITFLAVYFAPLILKGLRITDPIAIQIFRFGTVGAFFHAYILIITIILLYYNLRMDTLIVVTVFAFSNIGLTFLSKFLGPQTYGLGYLIACSLSLLLSFYYLYVRLKELEFLTFSQQPILGKKEDSPQLRAQVNGDGYGQYLDLKAARAE